ncbi:MAG: hypothetical protein ACI9TH_000282 [Kiritimatiellia bacterium]|jgi:acid phosphatase type 7
MKSYLILLLAAQLSTVSLFAKTERLRIGWFDDPATKAMICWDQVSGDHPVLYYDTVKRGEQLKAYKYQQKPTAKNDYHQMNNTFSALKNLQPDTAYYCALADSEGLSRTFWFRTAPNKPQSFSFAAGGDTKSEPGARERGRLSNSFIPKLQPLFVIYAGDFTSGNGLNATYWKYWLADWEEDTTTADGRIFPIVPVRGNHEEHEDILYKIFNMSDKLGYFAFNVGGDMMRVYALNSEINIKNPATRGNRNKDSADLRKHTAWLEKDLAAHPNSGFKIVSYHKPFRPHTKKKSENDYIAKPWAPVFEKYGVDAAIEGDSHMSKITYPIRMDRGEGSDEGFIRDDTKGTVYMGEGSWGAGTRVCDDDKSWTLASGRFAQFKWVHVAAHAIKIHTVITEKPAPEMGSVQADQPLTVPAGTPLFDNNGKGPVITVPRRAK